MEQSFLSKETTRWQGLGIEPPTYSVVGLAVVFRSGPFAMGLKNYCTDLGCSLSLVSSLLSISLMCSLLPKIHEAYSTHGKIIHP